MIGRTERWFAVVNQHGQMSTISAYRDWAILDRSKRADRDICRVAEVQVTVKSWADNPTSPKGVKKRAAK